VAPSASSSAAAAGMTEGDEEKFGYPYHVYKAGGKIASLRAKKGRKI
jgi:hypothetical protein